MFAGIIVAGLCLVILFFSITTQDVMISIGSIVGGLVLSAFGELIKVFLSIEKNTRNNSNLADLEDEVRNLADAVYQMEARESKDLFDDTIIL